MLLLAAAQARIGRSNILTGRPLEDGRETGSGVTACFAERRCVTQYSEESGNLLIGAEGIHSSLRRRLYPDEGPPLWNGAILWRGTARAKPILPGRSMIMAGHESQKFVCYPISEPDTNGKATINFTAHPKSPPDTAGPPGENGEA